MTPPRDADDDDILRLLPDATGWALVSSDEIATVWSAFDPKYARKVAVKALRLDQSDAAGRWFLRTSAALQRALELPGIVGVLRVARTDSGRMLIEMDWCGQGSLAARLGSGPMPSDEAVGLIAQVGTALSAAHELELLHLDLRPENVLFDNFDRPVVTDFGLAHRESAGGPATSPASLPFSAPEILRGELATPAADTWMLAATYFAMRTGQAPFGDRDPTTVLLRRMERGEIRGAAQSSLTAAERSAVDTAFIVDPASRPTPMEFVAMLQSHPVVIPAVVAAVPPPVTPYPPARRRWAPLMVGIGVAAAVGVAAVAALSSSGDDETATPAATTTIPLAATDAPVPQTAATTVTTVVPASSAPAAAPPATTTQRASNFQMELIPAGDYWVGHPNPDVSASESKSKQIPLPAYFIDTYEVTNAQYERFIEQGAARPIEWSGTRDPQYPVIGVSFDLASAYCMAVGKRLPTEAEWEVASRAPEDDQDLQFPYPWGKGEFDANLAPQGHPVGSNPATESRFGVFDLAGSAFEWVGDTYEDTGQKATQLIGKKILRGGLNDYLRRNTLRLAVDPGGSLALKKAGFRCAQSTDLVDETAEERNPVVSDPATLPAAPEIEVPELPEGYLIKDDFAVGFGPWTEDTQTDGGNRRKWGYHPDGFCHIETLGADQFAAAFSPTVVSPAVRNYTWQTTSFVEQPKTMSAAFSYGLAVRFSQSDPAGRADGLLFLVDVTQNGGGWRVVRQNADGTQTATGLDGPLRISKDSTVELVVAQSDTQFSFSVNGVSVLPPQEISGFAGFDHLNSGLAVLSSASEQVHIHFDEFSIKEPS